MEENLNCNQNTMPVNTTSLSRLTKKLVDSTSEKSFAFKFRKKRTEKIITLIDKCYEAYGEVKIIDIGGTKAYWSIIPMDFLLEVGKTKCVFLWKFSEWQKNTISKPLIFEFNQITHCNKRYPDYETRRK
jgi:hypothetical protein